ncbi:MAG TPA: thioredoxin family protein [Chitinophagaceae bacterium]|nr:thioredoxin family protein [Chitinophagaceae bacterium]
MNTLVVYTEKEINAAFEIARNKRLPVLVDFWSEGCKGCKKMNEITYQNDKVLNYLEKNFVFVKYNTKNRQPEFRNTYISSPHLWTPAFIVFANDGSEVRKVSGYLPPGQFINEMELGRAMAAIRKAQSPEALKILENIYTNSDSDPLAQEALYWAGVSAFYANRKRMEHLVPYWEKLLNQYPESIWAERADCLAVEV